MRRASRQLPSDVLVVTMLPREELAGFRQELDLPFTCLSDPDASVYARYGLERAETRRLYHPAVVLAYVRLLVSGRRMLPPTGQDMQRLGGDFVIGPAGDIRFAHRSRHPADRPPVERLIRALKRCAPP
ncbi:MAG: AhpC/TSA family protein [Clostridia bacterium]